MLTYACFDSPDAQELTGSGTTILVGNDLYIILAPELDRGREVRLWCAGGYELAPETPLTEPGFWRASPAGEPDEVPQVLADERRFQRRLARCGAHGAQEWP